jgi:hypothetical protein
MFKKTVLGAAMAASLMGLAGVAQAQIVVEVAPPAPLVEVMPAPRDGFEWVPGHYEFRDGRYVWMRGHWIEDRPGFVYVAPRWVQRANGDWVMTGGTWERRSAGRGGPRGDLDGDGIINRLDDDRDGDGILNAHDDRPNVYDRPVARRNGPNGDLDGDGISNRNDRDRDGDGVANWDDEFPNDDRYS